MGRTRTPAYVVRFDRVLATDGKTWRQVALTPSAWDTRQLGKPTEANLVRFIQELESSTAPGGANAHLGVMSVAAARLVRQRDGKTVATWHPAPFGVLGSAPRKNPASPGPGKGMIPVVQDGWASFPIGYASSLKSARELATRAGHQMGANVRVTKVVKTLNLSSAIGGYSHVYLATFANVGRSAVSPVSYRENPKLTVFHANPRGRAIVQSRRVFAIAYKHVQDGKAYKHEFAAGVCLELLPDGSLRVYSRDGKRLWKDFK